MISDRLIYTHIVATGGIGSGIVFNLVGNETLGRNESRLAELMPFRDYCKQHIILHYLAVLLCGNTNFRVYPIGKVGDDATGRDLLKMMEQTGMDMSWVSVSTHRSTMFSVCFQYPDKSGGNLTAANSACHEVDEQAVSRFFEKVNKIGGTGICLAAPEVPVETRIALLRQGRERKYLNVASVLSGETDQFTELGGVALSDVIALNLDEARHFAGMSAADIDQYSIAKECTRRLRESNSSLTLLITCGASGVYYCEMQAEPVFTPAMKTTVVSTAGAGDAFLSGFLTGLSCGLAPVKMQGDTRFGATPVCSAVELGILIATLSLSSPHTINESINARAILSFVDGQNIEMDKNFRSLFSATEYENHSGQRHHQRN